MKLKLNINPKFKIPLISINANKKSESIDQLFNDIQKLNNPLRLLGKRENKTKEIYLYQIIRFFTLDKKVVCETKEDTYVVNKRIYELENELPYKLFIRISSSEIVSIKFIKDLEFTKNGSYKINLINNEYTYSSRRYIKKLKERLLKWKNYLN